MCPGICVHMCQDAHVKITGQHVGVGFFLFIMWSWGKELGTSGLAGGAFTHRAISSVPTLFSEPGYLTGLELIFTESLGSIYLCLIKGRCLTISIHHHIWYYNFLYLFLIYMCKSFACVCV